MPDEHAVNPRRPRRTGEVLSRLKRLGLFVTPTMIADDTVAHYLPDRETVHLGRDGASGDWAPWMERRAERLYRLRALNRRTGRGPTGDLLRLFLFFGDAWGWEYVRDTCVRGYQLNIRGATKGVANRVRGQDLTLDNLWMFVEDIAEDQYRPQKPNAAQIDRVRMTVALLKYGIPDGRMGTLERFVDDLMPTDADPEEMRRYKNAAPLMWTMLNLAEVDAIEALKGELSDRVLKRGIDNFRMFMSHLRYGFRRKVFRGPERPPSTNPLTAFGAAKHFRFSEAFRRMPLRMTPAQMVGAQFAQALVIAHGEEQAAKLSEFSDRWLAYFLKSEQCARWLERWEREVNKKEN